MTTQIERLRQEIRYEDRKFWVQIMLMIAAYFAGTAAMAGIILGVAHIIH